MKRIRRAPAVALFATAIAVLALTMTRTSEAHDDDPTGAHSLIPNAGVFAPGVNAAVWQDGSGATAHPSTIVAAIEPAWTTDAIWMLVGGAWRLYLPGVPVASTLASVPPIASLVLILSSAESDPAVPPSPELEGALLPDLVPEPASSLLFEDRPNGAVLLRFTTTSYNQGAGPLEIHGREATFSGGQNVDQRVYREDGTFFDRRAGSFTFHPTHGHIHFDDYALYTLESVDSTATRISEKTTSCVVDTQIHDVTLPGAPKERVYNACNLEMQGLSVGWADVYRWDLPDQEFDVTSLPAGRYRIIIRIDPKGVLLEADLSNNTSVLEFDLDVAARTAVVVSPLPPQP